MESQVKTGPMVRLEVPRKIALWAIESLLWRAAQPSGDTPSSEYRDAANLIRAQLPGIDR